jgi:DNA-directed RNA polymerase specialized sigma24 family protein
MDYTKVTDSELVTRVGQHNYPAFDELWKRYDRKVRNYFRSVLRDKNLAEDCYQQLFLEIWKNGYSYRGGNTCSFIMAIARNIYKNEIKKIPGLRRLHGQGACTVITFSETTLLPLLSVTVNLTENAPGF